MTSEKAVRVRTSLLHVDLKDMRPSWDAWCSKRGLTSSEAARRVIRLLLEGNDLAEVLPSPAIQEEGAGQLRRLEIRLTPAEHLAITEVAGREGMSVPRWLTGLVRLHMVGEQQLGEAEVKALARSSQVLLALGRNINQISRNMNQRVDSDVLTLAQIEYLTSLIRSHIEAVAAVLTANSRRWRR